MTQELYIKSLELLEARMGRLHWLWGFLSSTYLAGIAGVMAARKVGGLTLEMKVLLTFLFMFLVLLTHRGIYLAAKEIAALTKDIRFFDPQSVPNEYLKEFCKFQAGTRGKWVVESSMFMLMPADALMLLSIWVL